MTDFEKRYLELKLREVEALETIAAGSKYMTYLMDLGVGIKEVFEAIGRIKS